MSQRLKLHLNCFESYIVYYMPVIQHTQNYYVHIFMCMYFDACLLLDLEEVDNQVRRFFPESWLFDVVETK